MDNLLSMVGLCLRAGRLEVGEEPVGMACRLRRCRLLLTAADVAPASLRRAERFAREGQCLSLPLSCSKEELGGAVGRGSCAMAAVTDVGLALALVKKLAAAEPGKYDSLIERLQTKADRAAQRRQNSTKRPKTKKKQSP